MKFYISNFHYINEDSLDLSFLPVLARRKLSKLDRISLCAMNSAFESYTGEEPMLVFASQYGELERLDKIIEQYLEDNEVSPAAFSSSVHNSVVGMFSLLKKIKKSYNSVAADKNTFSAGLLEAVLSAGNDNVLYCYADSYEKSQAFSCIISKKISEAAVECELGYEFGSELKEDGCNAGNSSEIEQFMKLFNDTKKADSIDYMKYFCSNDGLFFVKRC